MRYSSIKACQLRSDGRHLSPYTSATHPWKERKIENIKWEDRHSVYAFDLLPTRGQITKCVTLKSLLGCRNITLPWTCSDRGSYMPITFYLQPVAVFYSDASDVTSRLLPFLPFSLHFTRRQLLSCQCSSFAINRGSLAVSWLSTFSKTHSVAYFT